MIRVVAGVGSAMKIHAIQTGSVRIKTAQVEGRGHGLARRLAIFADRNWTEWLPTYAWIIAHPDGIIVVDTGQGAHLLDTGRSLHPFSDGKSRFGLSAMRRSVRSCASSASGRATCSVSS